MILIDGVKISDEIKKELEEKVKPIVDAGERVPGLVTILVGDDPASQSYVRSKYNGCKKLGMHSKIEKLDASTSEEELLAIIKKYNEDPDFHGILVQLPLPKHLKEEKIIEAISPEKDVDGLHPISVGNIVIGKETFYPCTPNGIVEMLKRYKIETSGKHVVVVGRSNIVGKPIANMMLQKKEGANSIVTICHSAAKDLAYFTKQADILIAAIGRANYIKADMVKVGAVVVDVGINRVEDSSTEKGYKLVGDVDFESVAPKTSYITPVPGGVGKMTIAMLLKNTYEAYLKIEKNNRTEKMNSTEIDKIINQVLTEKALQKYYKFGETCNGWERNVVDQPIAVQNIIENGAERIAAGIGVGQELTDKNVARMIDHTLLKADATIQDIKKLCSEAREYSFASVCVNPSYVSLCHDLLKGSIVKVCTVIGFPLGATSTQAKRAEAEDALINGAQEIDMVINIGMLKSGEYDYVFNDINQVVLAAKKYNAVSKVIIETSLLTDEEKIKACLISKKAKADFVKTSTGFSTGGATASDVALMKYVVGSSVGVKASGGIRTREDAESMIASGADRIGASASVKIVKGEKTGTDGY